MKLKNYTTGELLKIIRNYTTLSQREFGEKIGKSKNWVAVKEIELNRIYITDFIHILKTFNLDLELHSLDTDIKLLLNSHKPNEILRFMRESTGKNQTEFASTINKTRGWQYLNESGETVFYANDLFLLAIKHNFEIEIKKT